MSDLNTLAHIDLDTAAIIGMFQLVLQRRKKFSLAGLAAPYVTAGTQQWRCQQASNEGNSHEVQPCICRKY